MTLTVNIPVGTSAKIQLPGVAGPVLESGKPAASQPGLKATGETEGMYGAEGGNYVFDYPYAQPATLK
jgi:hypothetical protein